MNETIVIIAVSVALLAVAMGCSAMSLRFAQRASVAVVAGGLSVPLLFILGLLYWLLTMGVDDAPPGMVILGCLTGAALTAPATFFVSLITVWLLRRRAERNGR